MTVMNISSTSDNENNARKRVCKACDRCRLKKSKCDGASPCGRCKADNQICVFGERKKAHDKIYPKGYVEMLEQQQAQLVNGLRELYERSIDRGSWIGLPLKPALNGFPLTHDILERLGALKLDNTEDCEPFEDDLETLQKKALCQDYDCMSPTSPLTDSRPSSKRTSRAALHPTNEAPRPLVPLQLPPTPPDQSPTESCSDNFSKDVPMHMDSVGFTGTPNWVASPDLGTGIDFIDLDPITYNDMGFSEQKANPCFPFAYNNDDDMCSFLPIHHM